MCVCTHFLCGRTGFLCDNTYFLCDKTLKKNFFFVFCAVLQRHFQFQEFFIFCANEHTFCAVVPFFCATKHLFPLELFFHRDNFEHGCKQHLKNKTKVNLKHSFYKVCLVLWLHLQLFFGTTFCFCLLIVNIYSP